MVVILFASLTLFGIGALTIDVGGFYSEKGQLQNGADAAALAAANLCAKGHCSVAGDLTPRATTLANDNALDGKSQVEEVCGSMTGGVCSKPNTCPPPGGAANWVDVHVSTLTEDDAHALPSIFGKAVVGDDYDSQIDACAQAQWGPVGGGTGLALGMSVCDWLADTGSSTVGDANAKYATPTPPYPTNAWPPAYSGPTVKSGDPPVANPGGENVILVAGTEGKNCAKGPSGQNVPGGFGWLSLSANGQDPPNCQIKSDANGYVFSGPGGIGGSKSDCADAFNAIYAAGKTIPNSVNPIFIPVFDLQCNSSGKLMPGGTTLCPSGMPTSSFHIAGYAEFVVTGFDYNPLSGASFINAKHPCGGSAKCLYGMFTRTLVTDPGATTCTSGCPNLGATVVKLTG